MSATLQTPPRGSFPFLQRPEKELAEEVRLFGDLMGLKSEGGVFRAANFERALVLDGIMRERRPLRALEIGTGRGFGCFTLSAAAARHGTDTRIVTLDVLAPRTKQRWPIRWDGKEEVALLSRSEVWSRPELARLRGRIEERTGKTTRLLPESFRKGERFDFVFIDAGHDLFAVFHDLAWAALLLAEGGCVLMDDFAPMEDFGLGTCIAVSHARRWFATVEVFQTDGVVFGGGPKPGGRGMVFLDGLKAAGARVSRGRLVVVALLSRLLDLAFSPRVFPLAR